MLYRQVVKAFSRCNYPHQLIYYSALKLIDEKQLFKFYSINKSLFKRGEIRE